jgi:hypothetical protein
MREFMILDSVIERELLRFNALILGNAHYLCDIYIASDMAQGFINSMV